MVKDATGIRLLAAAAAHSPLLHSQPLPLPSLTRPPQKNKQLLLLLIPQSMVVMCTPPLCRNSEAQT